MSARSDYETWLVTKCAPHQRYECRECAEAEIVALTVADRRRPRTQIELSGIWLGWFAIGTIRVTHG